jgi:hypothetical protein
MDDSELRTWFALRDLEQRFVMLLVKVPADPKRPELWVDYEDARAELAAPITVLRSCISDALGGAQGGRGDLGSRVFSAILIHYDERELSVKGPDWAAPKCPLLQSEHCGIYDGGDYFVEFLQDALRASSTPLLVLELLLFCLRSGFCGRFSGVDDPERQARIKELIERVERAGPVASAPEPARDLRAIEGAGFPLGYYLGAVGVVLSLWLVLQLASGIHERKLLGKDHCELR